MSLPPTAGPMLAGIHILIVEDDDTIRELLADILMLEGAEVTTAASGNEARATLRTVRPQLIISDIMMADGDGHDLLRSVQADPLLNGIPFIFLSARSEPADQRRSMNLGADDYLVKPVSRQDLIHAVRTRLTRSKVAGRCQRQLLDQFRDELARSVPHELLTPLHTIRGASEILALEPGLESSGRELVDMIIAGCDRMTRTVKRFWRWSEMQLELRGLPPGQTTQPPRGVVAHSDRLTEVAQGIAEEAGRAGDLKLDIQPVRLPISDDHLLLLAQELVDNAFKFSAAGQRVEVALRPTGEGWSLSVSDCGCGMNAAQMEAIGPLRQFGRQEREQQGPGLGLALAAAVARLNGLGLRFQPAVPRGLSVAVSFPNPQY